MKQPSPVKSFLQDLYHLHTGPEGAAPTNHPLKLTKLQAKVNPASLYVN